MYVFMLNYGLLCISHIMGSLPFICHSYNNPRRQGKVLDCHLIDEETETQRSALTCLKSDGNKDGAKTNTQAPYMFNHKCTGSTLASC